MMQVKSLEIEDLDNAGCNNGNYPIFRAITFNDQEIAGITCRCGRGCSNTTAVSTDYSTDPPTYWVGVEGQQEP